MKLPLYHLLLCYMLLLSHDAIAMQNSPEEHSAQAGTVTRYYYIHHNQLRQQILQITGPAYNAASMNLASLYDLTANNQNLTLGSLVNSSTCGNVTLGSMVNSATMGNATLATIISRMQNYAFLTASSLTSFTVTRQSPTGLISTDGTTITFATGGFYMIVGAFLGTGHSGLTNAAMTLSDVLSGVTLATYSTNNLTTNLQYPVSFPYNQTYTIAAGGTLAFTQSSNWDVSNLITLCIIRIE